MTTRCCAFPPQREVFRLPSRFRTDKVRSGYRIRYSAGAMRFEIPGFDCRNPEDGRRWEKTPAPGGGSKGKSYPLRILRVVERQVHKGSQRAALQIEGIRIRHVEEQSSNAPEFHRKR